MAATMKGPVAVEDVNVTFEDQQKINKFARNTSRMTELKNEIEAKKKLLQNLQDASDDLMMSDDDSLLIPYQIGDVFISHTQEETQEMLEAAKTVILSLNTKLLESQKLLLDALEVFLPEAPPHSGTVPGYSLAADVLESTLVARQPLTDDNQTLDTKLETLEQEVKGLEERVSAIQQVLGDLKIQLYAKFGNNINLEADES